MSTFHSFWTLCLLVLFIAIFFWAWSSRRKGEFEEAARLPLDDDQLDNEEQHHG